MVTWWFQCSYHDFRKAFDSVSHGILLDKLHHYGVRGIAHSWFESYLTGRNQYININGASSGNCNSEYSVPQSSKLGLLLFLFYINDLPVSSDYFKFTLFVDDCTVSSVIATKERFQFRPFICER